MSRLKILRMKIRIKSGRVAAFLVALLLIGGGAGVLLLTGYDGDHGTAGQARAEQLYTCGMHPQVIQDHPGNCPICGMKLTPVRKQDSGTGATFATPDMAAAGLPEPDRSEPAGADAVWSSALRTLSQSEEGFDIIHQGYCLCPVWSMGWTGSGTSRLSIVLKERHGR